MGFGNSFDSFDPGMDAFEGAAMGIGGFFAVFFLVFYLLMFAYAIITYVLMALGMHSIAKRRGIRHPWLSWLPLGDLWILGSISDQYQYVAKGKVRSRRKVLLGLAIAGMCLLFLMMIGLIVGTVGMIASEAGSEAVFGIVLAAALLQYVAIFVLAIISVVFQYIALYDLYASCNPDNAVLFLVLSIFLGIAPFFVFFNRGKDLGMPPRKELESPVVEPVVGPVVE